MQVYIEPLEATPRLYVIGAGHVGYHLARLAHTIGFRTHVLDDREKFANAERFPDADEVIVETIPDWLHRADLPSNAYVVDRDARAYARSRRAARARRPRSPLPRI